MNEYTPCCCLLRQLLEGGRTEGGKKKETPRPVNEAFDSNVQPAAAGSFSTASSVLCAADLDGYVALGDKPTAPRHTPGPVPRCRPGRWGGPGRCELDLRENFFLVVFVTDCVCFFVWVPLCSLGIVGDDRIRLRSPTATGGPAHIRTRTDHITLWPPSVVIFVCGQEDDGGTVVLNPF
jgi:hypothetical protein